MTTKPFNTATFFSAAALSVAAQENEGPTRKRPEELISKLSSTNEVDVLKAYESAPEFGQSAVRPLGFTMGNKDFEVARKAKRALLRIVHHAGRPGAEKEAAGVESRIIPMLTNKFIPLQARRDLIWLLSEIASARAVEPVAALLNDKDLREDARCVLVRMPFLEAAKAMHGALENADGDFKSALADGLRARGEKVENFPSKKLIPTAQTTVTAKK